MKNEVCHQCYEGISNPVCEKCYSKELANWLKDSNLPENIIRSVILKIRMNISDDDNTETLCVLCQNKYVTLCTYCFFFKIENVLHNSGISEALADHFLQIFNYKLYHTIFTKEEN